MSNGAFMEQGETCDFIGSMRRRTDLCFLAKTFGTRQTRAWLNQNLINPQARGAYRPHKSSGGSCGISDELINMERAS